MYQVDKKDRVEELADVPQSSVGAPCPFLVADERKVLLAFTLQERDDSFAVTSEGIVVTEPEEPVAIVEFKSCYKHIFGSPNDEVFISHPLHERGLRPYAAYEIKNSSWIRQIERMNSVHPRHDSERFLRRHHYIFAFHDSTFECVADGFRIVETRGSIKTLLLKMCEMLADDS